MPRSGDPALGPGFPSASAFYARFQPAMRRLNDGRGPRSTSIRFTKPTVARILIRASAFNSRGVTTVRKSRCCRGLECGNLHGRARQRGKTRRTDLAWRRREHLRSSHVGGSRNHKDPHQRSWQEEHAVCLHAVQIYDRSKRNVSPTRLSNCAIPTRERNPYFIGTSCILVTARWPLFMLHMLQNHTKHFQPVTHIRG
jgi:hypothetical protein